MISGSWALLALFLWAFNTALVGESPASGALQTAQISRASDSTLEARVRELASELRCPVCQGESIQDSPAALAQEMKAIVREQLAAGRTPDEVKAYFVEKYGEWILLRPKAQGWNVMVYLLPLVALLGGAVVVARATRRWSTTSDTTVVEPVGEETADT
ncbi:MAG TPA: cytochrome c-type biogenesis protein [Gemmatimonadaceae bacterium]|nr:cytochrome c-type biogenesis protein [Gemmatimonadaceae bacterium]